jgi:6-phosphogluconate dehydrogenase
MGANMVERLVRGGHKAVGYDRDPAAVAKVVAVGGGGASSLAELASKLRAPRTIWIMVPNGPPVDQTINDLLPHLAQGDLLVDGGNSNYKESMRRAAELKTKGFLFMDAGTSGGVWGLQNGYCLMVGGTPEAVKLCEPIFKTLAPPDGYAHMGPAGAGHYVKMVHNGIEYGLMQAYAEGFEIMKTSPFGLDLHKIASIWGHGSVVRSWLLELLESALKDDSDLKSIRGWVADSGEGRWTVQASIDQDVPAPIITLSLQARFRSRQDESYGAKILAALRNQFGGHAVKKS